MFRVGHWTEVSEVQRAARFNEVFAMSLRVFSVGWQRRGLPLLNYRDRG
jgi:hypothetical protein